jgi:hypothetical protein
LDSKINAAFESFFKTKVFLRFLNCGVRICFLGDIEVFFKFVNESNYTPCPRRLTFAEKFEKKKG